MADFLNFLKQTNIGLSSANDSSIMNDQTKDKINSQLKIITSGLFINPMIAMWEVRKLLSRFNVEFEPIQNLPMNDFSTTFKVLQMGADQGVFLFFEANKTQTGLFKISSQLMSEGEIDTMSQTTSQKPDEENFAYNKKTMNGYGLDENEEIEEVKSNSPDMAKKHQHGKMRRAFQDAFEHMKKMRNHYDETSDQVKKAVDAFTAAKNSYTGSLRNNGQLAEAQEIEEQYVDEISKERLIAYSNAAAKDQPSKIDLYRAKLGTKKRENLSKKYEKRSLGRSLAAAKISEKKAIDEENELEEISTERKRDYVKNALASSIALRKAGTDEKGKTSNRSLINKANKRGKKASNLDDQMKKENLKEAQEIEERDYSADPKEYTINGKESPATKGAIESMNKRFGKPSMRILGKLNKMRSDLKDKEVSSEKKDEIKNRADRMNHHLSKLKNSLDKDFADVGKKTSAYAARLASK